jgi:hypothetical protein
MDSRDPDVVDSLRPEANLNAVGTDPRKPEIIAYLRRRRLVSSSVKPMGQSPTDSRYFVQEARNLQEIVTKLSRLGIDLCLSSLDDKVSENCDVDSLPLASLLNPILEVSCTVPLEECLSLLKIIRDGLKPYTHLIQL